MQLSGKIYCHTGIRFLDEPVPTPDAKKPEPGRSPVASVVMTDNQGLNYVAVRNCDLERFSAK